MFVIFSEVVTKHLLIQTFDFVQVCSNVTWRIAGNYSFFDVIVDSLFRAFVESDDEKLILAMFFLSSFNVTKLDYDIPILIFLSCVIDSFIANGVCKRSAIIGDEELDSLSFLLFLFFAFGADGRALLVVDLARVLAPELLAVALGLELDQVGGF